MDERKEANAIELDFSPLLTEGEKFAVHCETEEDAIHFLKCLRQAYPRRCRTWSPSETHWGAHEKMCYRPNLNMPDEYTLKYCSLEHYEQNGFKIIRYDELIIHPDIKESEQSLGFLLN